VPQSGGLLPFLNVKDNIELPRKMVGCSDYDSLLEEVIERLQLSPLMGRSPAQLSIGERQRVSFVRAIAHRPKLLLADEPTGNLDVRNSAMVFDLLTSLARQNGQAIVVVTHNPELAARCDHTLPMRDGQFAS
jgi:putative ABC transport system ATP-binding protein